MPTNLKPAPTNQSRNTSPTKKGVVSQSGQNKVNFQGIDKTVPTYHNPNYIEDSLTSGKMTPKARRQPTTLGLKQSTEFIEAPSGTDDLGPQRG